MTLIPDYEKAIIKLEKKDTDRLAFKRNLFRYSIYGFIGGIVASLVVLAINIPFAFIDDSLFDNRFLSGILEFAEFGPFLLLAVTFLSFGALLYSVLLQPRGERFTAKMDDLAVNLLVIFLGGALLFALIVTLPPAIFMISLFSRNGNIIYLLFGIAITLIAACALFVLLRIFIKIVKRHELPAWLSKILQKR
jgi:magnesium-transporting ATPase (P-type)